MVAVREVVALEDTVVVTVWVAGELADRVVVTV